MQKILRLLTLLWLTAALTGCYVVSVHPYFTETDVIFDDRLNGHWRSDDMDWLLEPEGKDAYRLTITEGDRATSFDTHLFQINGQWFLDTTPREFGEIPDSLAIHLAPLHFLFRVKLDGDRMSATALSRDWLASQFETGQLRLRHRLRTNDSELLLTGSSRELREFLGQTLNQPELYEDALNFERHHPQPPGR